MKNLVKIFILFISVSICSNDLNATDRLKVSKIAFGTYQSMNNSHMLKGTLGQVSIGISQNSSMMGRFGFWYINTAARPMFVEPYFIDPGIVGIPYPEAHFIVQGGNPPYTMSISGNPPGLLLTPDGILSGIPEADGDFEILLSVQDNNGQLLEKTYRIAILPSSCASFDFMPPVNYGSGFGMFDLEKGDFNGDGNIDLVTTNWSFNFVKVLLGDGLGGFAIEHDFPVGVRPRALTVADFNNDGRQDIAVTNEGSGFISVLFGNGDATFREAVNYDFGFNPWALTAGDVNNDGFVDLAVTNLTGSRVCILIGTGNGNFALGNMFPVASFPFEVECKDLNNDGNNDIVTANQSTGTIAVLMGSGDGNFSTPEYYPVGDYPRGLAIADFNMDNIPDIATANYNSNDLTVLTGLGNGEFDLSDTKSCGEGPICLAKGDLSSDGIIDLICCNATSNNLSLFAGRGDGTFKDGEILSSDFYPRGITCGDFDFNGKIDFALTCRYTIGLYSYLNQCNLAPIAKCRDLELSADEDCQAEAFIDDGSVDPEGSMLTFTQDPPGPYPSGNTIVTLTAIDDRGGEGSCQALVSVKDDTPPILELISEPVVLFPVNHQYQDFDVNDFIVNLSDNCDINPKVKITKVESDELENAPDGDGNTIDDIVIYNDCQGLQLRKERLSEEYFGNGRVYTIHIQAEDFAGNTTELSCTAVALANINTPAQKENTLYSVDCNGSLNRKPIAGLNQNIDYYLGQNYPNPFENTTTIEYHIAEGGLVKISLYDIHSEKLMELVNGYHAAGIYTYELSNPDLPNGVYIYKLEINGCEITKLMTHIN